MDHQPDTTRLAREAAQRVIADTWNSTYEDLSFEWREAVAAAPDVLNEGKPADAAYMAAALPAGFCDELVQALDRQGYMEPYRDGSGGFTV